MSDRYYDDRNHGKPDRPDPERKKFVVSISDEDYESESAYTSPRNTGAQRQNAQRRPGSYPQQRQRPNQPAGRPMGLQRRDLPVSRTRVITTRTGEKYEIPEENPLASKNIKKTRKNQKSRGCIVAVVYAIIVCSISALLSFYIIVGINDMFGLIKEDAEIVVEVPPESDLDAITKLLDENGVVDYPFFFKLYAQFTNDDDFKHGTFTLNSKSDYDMIIRKLTRPASADKSIVKVTFPEGYNIEQIAELLDYNCVCESENFYKTMETYAYSHKFMPLIPVNDVRIYRLEGYLFPDTYSFYINEGSVSAINRMLNAFDSKIFNNTELAIQARANALGVSVDQIITMASIIERESPDPEQMKNVASVFYNRMRNPSHDGTGGMLQSDATRWYPFTTGKAMRESETLTEEQKTNWVSAYDTTTFAGLPPGPICCPGYNSIYAACYPNNTGYYYFFMDDNGTHFYASTYGEHLQNIENARANGTYSG